MNYLLDGRQVYGPVRIEDFIHWIKSGQGTIPTRVAGNSYHNYWVSTTFLGIDHGIMDGGPPIVFETMIFAPPGSAEIDYQTRCATWDEAEAMHREAIQWLLGYLAGDCERPTKMDRCKSKNMISLRYRHEQDRQTLIKEISGFANTIEKNRRSYSYRRRSDNNDLISQG